jgi:hypothetical protein
MKLGKEEERLCESPSTACSDYESKFMIAGHRGGFYPENS